MKHPINQLIVQLKHGIFNSKSCIRCKYSKYSYLILKILYTEGYILKYTISFSKHKEIIVYFKSSYKDATLKDIRSLYNKIAPLVLTHKKLKRYISRHSPFNLIILSTQLGFMTHYRAIQLGIGGTLLVSCF
jgi:ribosomal protein S8